MQKKQPLYEKLKSVSRNHKELLKTLLAIGDVGEDTIEVLTTNKYVEMFKIAFVHKLKNETRNYQRVEFMGDGLVNVIIAIYVYNERKIASPSELTNMKHKLVASKFLGTNFIEKTGIINLLDPPLNVIREKISRESEIDKISGDVFEAMIGELFNIVKSKFHVGTAFEIVYRIVIAFVKTVPIPSGEKDPKTAFKELLEEHPELKIPDLNLNTESKIDQLAEGKKMYYYKIYKKGFGNTKKVVVDEKGEDEREVRTRAYNKALLAFKNIK